MLLKFLDICVLFWFYCQMWAKRPLFDRRHGVLPRYRIKVAILVFNFNFLVECRHQRLVGSIKFLVAVSVLTNILFSTGSSSRFIGHMPSFRGNLDQGYNPCFLPSYFKDWVLLISLLFSPSMKAFMILYYIHNQKDEILLQFLLRSCS